MIYFSVERLAAGLQEALLRAAATDEAKRFVREHPDVIRDLAADLAADAGCQIREYGAKP